MLSDDRPRRTRQNCTTRPTAKSQSDGRGGPAGPTLSPHGKNGNGACRAELGSRVAMGAPVSPTLSPIPTESLGRKPDTGAIFSVSRVGRPTLSDTERHEAPGSRVPEAARRRANRRRSEVQR
jgi:hypothetical protein